jgi:hypothetical protein
LTARIFAVPFCRRQREQDGLHPVPAVVRSILRQNRLRWRVCNRSFAGASPRAPGLIQEQDKEKSMQNGHFEKGNLHMTKTLNERIAETKEKIIQYENQAKQLIQKQKDIERKARTRRLIERGAILESFFAEPETLSNEQVKERLAKWSASHGER